MLISGLKIEIIKADITKLYVDAIVNAAKFVIHTVGPLWNGGKRSEPE